MHGRVLIIAGSDSGGGAGIQADIKTVTALGGFAMTAVTALTAQNTRGVDAIHEVPPDFVAAQLRAVLSDLGADCVKFGMLHRADVITAVMDVLNDLAPEVPRVVDPVMVAKGGASLLQADAAAALAEQLLPAAAVLTPNIPEAEVLTGSTIADADDMERAGGDLLERGPGAVLMKGGHLEGDELVDVLVSEAGVERFAGTRLETRHTHGTGCTLASGIAAGLAQGLSLTESVGRAREYVRRAIASAPGFGSGHGPLNHAHTVTGMDDT